MTDDIVGPINVLCTVNTTYIVSKYTPGPKIVSAVKFCHFKYVWITEFTNVSYSVTHLAAKQTPLSVC